jgi:hypothetical protein
VLFDTVGADHDINGLSDGDSTFSECTIVFSTLDGQLYPKHWHDRETLKHALSLPKKAIFLKTLKDFGQDKISKEDFLVSE